MGSSQSQPSGAPKSAATDLHIIDGGLRDRTFDIVTLRPDGSVDVYVACNVVKDYSRILAAAPDLLAALQGSIGALEFNQDFHRDLGNEEQAFVADKLDAALKAIAKATGQETTGLGDGSSRTATKANSGLNTINEVSQ